MATTRLTFAEVHRRAREDADLTQQQAADRLGVSLRIVQHWEAGTKEPRFPHLVACATLYGWELPFLTGTRPRPSLIQGGRRQRTSVRREASTGNGYFPQLPREQRIRVAV